MSMELVSVVFMMLVDNKKQFFKDDPSKSRQRESHREARAA